MRRFWGATIPSIFAVVAVFAAAPLPAYAADGKALFTTCQACHGAKGEGNRQLGAPNIAGLDANYIARQLRNFASGVRGAAASDSYGAQMRAAASVLPSDADRTAVAAYIAGLPPAAVTAPAEKADLSNGRNYFNAVCSACHGANGLGNQGMNVPRLAGTDPNYLTRQFAAFRAGARGNHKDDKLGAQMRAIVTMLPDAKTDRDVIAYIASLKP